MGILKLKQGDCNLLTHKAPLVVKGLGQKKGIDFN